MKRAVQAWARIALLFGVVSCGRGPGPSGAHPSLAVRAAPSDAGGETSLSLEKTETQHKVAEFLARVAAARRLPARAPVEAEELDRAALIAGVRAHVARELPPHVIRNQGELLVGLGLVPPDFDYEEGTFRLLEAQLAGFYEYRTKKMYLAADLDEDAADLTLAHELVHALQDQYYDLGKHVSYKPEANDRESAVQSLAEGDATSAMMDVMNPARRPTFEMSDDLFTASIEGSMNATAGSAAAPAVLRASLLAPYVDGVLFVHALRRRGVARGNADASGWDEVDRAWKSPPETTEQLLHLDKYDAREPAERLGAVLPPAQQGWVTVYEDIFGEQGLRIAAEQWMPKKVAATAASGWGGDRLAVFRRASGDAASTSGEPGATANARVPAGTYAVAWHLRFDPGRQDVDVEARQAFKAIADGLRARRDAGASTTVCVERGALGPMAVVRNGRDIAIAAGPYEHEGARVSSRAACAQTVRWAADIVRRSSQ